MLLCVFCGKSFSFFPFGNGIESARMERVAFTDSFESEPKTEDHTMLLQGFNAIVRAAGMEAAPLSQPWADRLLVQSNQQNRRFCR